MINKAILLISSVFPPEPVVSARLVSDLAVALRDKGNYVVVLRPKATRPFGFKFDCDKSGIIGIEEIVLDSFVCAPSKLIGRMYESYSFGLKCVEYISEHHNSIGCIYFCAWPLFAQKKIAKAAVKYLIPCITHVQDIYPESYIIKLPLCLRSMANSFMLPIDKYVLQHSNHILVISDKMKHYLSKTRDVEESYFTVVQNWQDETKFLEMRLMNINNKHMFTFMFVGSISPSANVLFLLKSFIKFNRNDLSLVICGDGSDKAQCVDIASHYKTLNISFDSITPKEVPLKQQQADVLILSLKKGISMTAFPSKLCAYMFSSKPVITCIDKQSDTAKTIIESDCGWVVESENEDALINVMKNATLFDSEELKKKGENGFNYAMKHFSKAENLKLIVDVIEKLTES